VGGQQLHFARLCDLGDRFEGRLPLCWVEASDPEAVEIARRAVRVNCWHAEDVESDALWRIYGNNKEMVAVQTTTRQLVAAVKEHGVFVSGVTYFDPENHPPPDGETFFFPAFYKHHCFQHEREVRAIMLPRTLPLYEGEQCGGRDVPISVSGLVNSVFVSPYADDWFLDAVQDVARLGGLDVPVTFSPLRGLIT
jgi:hypothetical protein